MGSPGQLLKHEALLFIVNFSWLKDSNLLIDWSGWMVTKVKSDILRIYLNSVCFFSLLLEPGEKCNGDKVLILICRSTTQL